MRPPPRRCCPPAERSSAHGLRVGAEHLVERMRADPELRGVRLAHHDRARRTQAPDKQAIDRRNVIGEHGRPVGRPDPGGVLQILDGDRQSVQRAQRHTGSRAAVRGIRLGERLLRPQADNRVDPGVHRSDPLEMPTNDLAHRQFSATDRGGEVPRRPPKKRIRSGRPACNHGQIISHPRAEAIYRCRPGKNSRKPCVCTSLMELSDVC